MVVCSSNSLVLCLIQEERYTYLTMYVCRGFFIWIKKFALKDLIKVLLKCWHCLGSFFCAQSLFLGHTIIKIGLIFLAWSFLYIWEYLCVFFFFFICFMHVSYEIFMMLEVLLFNCWNFFDCLMLISSMPAIGFLLVKHNDRSNGINQLHTHDGGR